MHELSLCQSMLEIIHQHSAELHGQCVKKVFLEIGQLVAVDQAALRFAFEAITAGTIAEHAKLDIIEIEGQAICDCCQKTVRLKHYYDACELCGQYSLQITQGEALRIKSMEVG